MRYKLYLTLKKAFNNFKIKFKNKSGSTPTTLEMCFSLNYEVTMIATQTAACFPGFIALFSYILIDNFKSLTNGMSYLIIQELVRSAN